MKDSSIGLPSLIHSRERYGGAPPTIWKQSDKGFVAKIKICAGLQQKIVKMVYKGPMFYRKGWERCLPNLIHLRGTYGGPP
jgi:hypothetical protein